MVKENHEINENIQIKMWEDLYRYEGAKSRRWNIRMKYLFFVPEYTYIYVFRRTQRSENFLSFFIWSALLRIISYVTHIQIPATTQIGKGFYIGHWGMIIVNPSAVIGRNFSISAGALIGNAQGKHAGSPIIGDNVQMGQFAIIIGGCKIGNNVLIAPGAFVNFDVPDNCIVIGNPGKVIPQESSPTAKYIVFPIEESME